MPSSIESRRPQNTFFEEGEAQAYPGGMRLSPILGCIALALASLGVACGGSSSTSGAPLTCAWLSGPDNCWKNTASMAMTCLPPESDSGTLSANNATCSYASGAMVTFTPALTFPFPDDPTWNFTIADANGAPCLHFEESSGGAFKLTVGGTQTVTAGLSGTMGEVITCPDGSAYQTANAFDLLTGCGNFLPGVGWSAFDSPPSVSTSLAGLGDTSLSMFSCSGS
jgi:hypothetical protein